MLTGVKKSDRTQQKWFVSLPWYVGPQLRRFDGRLASVLGTESIQTSSLTSQPLIAGWCLGLHLGQLTTAFTCGFLRETEFPYNTAALNCISYIAPRSSVLLDTAEPAFPRSSLGSCTASLLPYHIGQSSHKPTYMQAEEYRSHLLIRRCWSHF